MLVDETPASSPVVASASLTDRQRQVMELRAQGLSNKVVAKRLGIKYQTVKNIQTSAHQRIGATSLVQFMNAMGWVHIDK